MSPKSKSIVRKSELVNLLQRQERCVIDLMWSKTPGILVHGLTTDEKLVVKSSIKDLIAKQTEQRNPDEDVPPEWGIQCSTVDLFYLSSGSSEWNNVEECFSVTMASHPIKNIVRIQNLYLWGKWTEEKRRLQKFKHSVNEVMLFHGTGMNDPAQIYNSEIGFDMRFCTSGMWGLANYFALNASYSHDYCFVNPSNGLREMFVVKLLAGDSYYSEPNRSLRMPPLKRNSDMGLSQVRYDTVNGNAVGSKVYMTYDNQKAYPAYLIEY